MARIITLIKFNIKLIVLAYSGLCLAMENNNDDEAIIAAMRSAITSGNQMNINLLLDHSNGFLNWNRRVLDDNGNNAFHLMARYNLTTSLRHALNTYTFGIEEINNDEEQTPREILKFNLETIQRHTTFNARK